MGGDERECGRRCDDSFTYSQGEINSSIVFHILLGTEGIFPRQHLDKGMSLVLVDDTSLHGTVAAKYSAKLSFRAPVYVVISINFQDF